MDTILSMIKGYFTLMLLLLVISYLTPAEHYRRYFQFVTGALLCVMLLRPLAAFFDDSGRRERQLLRQLEDIPKWQEKEADIDELYKADTQEKK